jgi:hypothetical protein
VIYEDMAEDLDEGWWREYRRDLEGASARSRWWCGAGSPAPPSGSGRGNGGFPGLTTVRSPLAQDQPFLRAPDWLRASVGSTEASSDHPTSVSSDRSALRQRVRPDGQTGRRAGTH